MMADITKMMVKLMAMKAIQSVEFGFANGGAFEGGAVTKFANGGALPTAS